MISGESAQREIWPIGLIPGNVFTGYKAIITRDSAQGAIMSIGLIPNLFLTGFK